MESEPEPPQLQPLSQSQPISLSFEQGDGTCGSAPGAFGACANSGQGHQLDWAPMTTPAGKGSPPLASVASAVSFDDKQQQEQRQRQEKEKAKQLERMAFHR